MTRDDKYWTAAIFVGWLVLTLFFFPGCSSGKPPISPQGEGQEIESKGPWTDSIAEDRELSTCDKARRIYVLAIKQDINLQRILDNTTTLMPEVKVVLKAQQRGLWELQHDLYVWISNSCAEV